MNEMIVRNLVWAACHLTSATQWVMDDPDSPEPTATREEIVDALRVVQSNVVAAIKALEASQALVEAVKAREPLVEMVKAREVEAA